MGAQFHETAYGRRFFEHQLPELIEALERLANAVELQNKLLGGKELTDNEKSNKKK